MRTLGAVCVAWIVTPAFAQELPKAKPLTVDTDKLLAEANSLKEKGKFDKALESYLKAYTAGRTDPEIRDQIRFCFRNVAQTERHRDPSFQHFVLSLTPSDALALYTEAAEKIHKLYTERDKATFERLFAAGLDELDRALGEADFRRTHLPDATDAKIAKFRQTVRDGWRAKLPVNPREMAHATRELVSAAGRQLDLKNGSAVVLELLCGACSGLDEYSTYIAPTGPQAELATPILEMAAYGLLVRFDPKGLVIEAVIPGSWAAVHTKLRKGDRVVRVNGKPLPTPTPALLLDAMRAVGPLGHDLELSRTDEDGNPVTVKLPTPLPTVYGIEMVNDKDGVGYLRLASFREHTPRELDEAVMELRARGMKVLIVDLRGNVGGSFTAAVSVAKLFLPAGLIVSTQGQAPEFANRAFSSDSGMAAYDFPVVLLVDTKTMSAAEILAAGLKDNLRATLVGLPTFGKGFVQAPIRLQAIDGPGDPQPGGKGGVMILSVASAFGPRGSSINGGGVTPNITEANPERQLAVAIEKAAELLTRPMPMIMR